MNNKNDIEKVIKYIKKKEALIQKRFEYIKNTSDLNHNKDFLDYFRKHLNHKPN